jgi:hypothetical protein
MRRRSVRNRQNLPVFYGESAIVRHFKSESAIENRSLMGSKRFRHGGDLSRLVGVGRLSLLPSDNHPLQIVTE